MKKSVLFNTCVSAFAALLISLTGCNNLTFTDSFDAANDFGARAVSSGSQPNHYVEVKATSTSGWEQTNKFQFKLSNLSIGSGKTVSFQIYTPENASKLTVRGVNSGSKWIKDVSVSGNKWYSVSATTTESETEIGITLYCTAKSGLKVRIGDLKVGDTWVAASSLKGNVKEYYASPKSFSVSTNDSSNPPDNPPVNPPTGNVISNSTNIQWIGFRNSDYGTTSEGKSEPSASKWLTYLERMTERFPNASPSMFLIVGTVHDSDKVCKLHFKGTNSGNIKYTSSDEYADLLTKISNRFPNASVFLQVEPGYNDVAKLAKLVLDHYKGYSCVKGFGIDNEWWYRGSKDAKYSNDSKKIRDLSEASWWIEKWNAEPDRYKKAGTPLTPTVAKELVNAVTAYNSNYKVYCKHWRSSYMPKDLSSSYAKNMIFVTDTNDERDIVTQYVSWSNDFASSAATVVFQIGYMGDNKDYKEYADSNGWGSSSKINNFLKAVAAAGDCDTNLYNFYSLKDSSNKESIKQRSNKKFGIIWVDFSLNRLQEVLGY